MAVNVHKVESSSHYQSQKYGKDGLDARNVIQNHPRFGGWLSGLNEWEHAWLQFEFTQPAILKHLVIENGYVDPTRSGDDYFRHLRVRDIRVSTAEEHLMLTLADSRPPQSFSLPFETPCQMVRLEVCSVYSDSPDELHPPHEVVGLRHVAWFDS